MVAIDVENSIQISRWVSFEQYGREGDWKYAWRLEI